MAAEQATHHVAKGVDHAAAATHQAAEAAHHGAEAGTHAAEHIPELPNVITLLSHRWHDNPIVAFLHHWENILFAVLVGVVVSLLAYRHARNPKLIPQGGQNVFEFYLDMIDGLAKTVIGESGRKYTPFLATLFLFIWLMNLSVLVPGLKSSTASLNTTLGMALVVFCYVNWLGISQHGLVRFFHHLAGEPKDVAGWLMVPLMLPLHILGEIIKPISLSLRLCFNVFAEDVLLAVICGLGITLGLAMHLPIGIPIQVLIVPLILIFSTVQALVFTLLSSVYIALTTAGGH